MTFNHDDVINSIISSIDGLEYIKSADIPNIELYMDQVTTFMEKRLGGTTRNPKTDKVFTKTMINNYVKSNIMPTPDKKKYSKEHMYILIVIYYFKNVLSINDIDAVLKPIREKYCGDSKDFNLEEIYEGIRVTAEQLTENIKGELLDTYHAASEIFPEAEGDDKEILTMFSFITLLILDVNIKKFLIEKIMDGYVERKPSVKEKDRNKKQ